MGQDLLSDLLPCLPHVGPLSQRHKYSSEHEFVDNDSQGEEVSFVGVVHPADNFGRHISGGAAGLVGVFVLLLPGHPEICEPGVSIFLENNIFWFQVPMDDVLGVDVLEGHHNAGDYKF